MIETRDVIERTWTPEKSGVDRGSGGRGTSATKHPSLIRFLWPVTFVFPEFVGPAMRALNGMFLGFIAISEFGFIKIQIETVIQFFKFDLDSASRLITFFYILHAPLTEYLVFSRSPEARSDCFLSVLGRSQSAQIPWVRNIFVIHARLF